MCFHYHYLSLSDSHESVTLQVAYTESGEPSKALLGFCKKNSLVPEDVEVEADQKGVEYVWGISRRKGLPAAEVICKLLPQPPDIRKPSG